MSNGCGLMRFRSVLPVLLLIASLMHGNQASDKSGTTGDTLTIVKPILLSKDGKVIRVSFSGAMDDSGPQYRPGGVKLEGAPPGVAISSAVAVPLESNVVLLNLSDPLSSLSGVKVCFPEVDWKDSGGV